MRLIRNPPRHRHNRHRRLPSPSRHQRRQSHRHRRAAFPPITPRVSMESPLPGPSPAASTSTPTWTCLCCTTIADDFQTGTIAAAFGAPPSLIYFAIQYKANTLPPGFSINLDELKPTTKPHRRRLPLHQFPTYPRSAHSKRWAGSFAKPLPSCQALHGLSRRLHGSTNAPFYGLRQAAKHSGLICITPEWRRPSTHRPASPREEPCPRNINALTRPTTARSRIQPPALSHCRNGGGPRPTSFISPARTRS